MILWLRHVRALPALGGAVVAAVIVRWLVATFMEGDGWIVLPAPLFSATVFVMSAMLLVTAENTWDRVAVRSVNRLRVVLLVIVVLVGAVASVLCFPDNATYYGSLAMLRNILGLLGLGLLSLTVVPRWAGWVVPAVVGIAFSILSEPWPPTTTASVWAALRTAGTLTTADGDADLSWWVCLAVFALGVASFLGSWRPVIPRTGQDAAHHRAGRRAGHRAGATGHVDARRGLRRAMFLPLLVTAMVVVLVWMLAVSVSDWGGRPDTLAAGTFPYLFLYFVPGVLVCGLIAGQYRWRSGVQVWETLSPRSPARRTWSAVRPVLLGMTVLTVPVLAGSLALTVGGALHDGVDAALVGVMFREGLPVTATVIVGVMAASVLGVLLGRRLRGIWVPPVVLIVTVVLGFSAVDRYEEPVIVASGDLTCRGGGDPVGGAPVGGGGPEVCTYDRDIGYLDAAVATAALLYDRSAFRDQLPGRLYLTDSRWPTEVPDAPVVSSYGEHRIVAPAMLDAEWMAGDIRGALGNACVPEGAGPEEAFELWMEGVELLFEDPATFPEWAEFGSTPERTRDMLARAQECFAGQR